MNADQIIRQLTTLRSKVESIEAEIDDLMDQLEYDDYGCSCGGADPDCSFHFPQEVAEVTERCAECGITAHHAKLDYRDEEWWCPNHF